MSIAATTKSKSSKPIFKTLYLSLTRHLYFKMCDCGQTVTALLSFSTSYTEQTKRASENQA